MMRYASDLVFPCGRISDLGLSLGGNFNGVRDVTDILHTRAKSASAMSGNIRHKLFTEGTDIPILLTSCHGRRNKLPAFDEFMLTNRV